MPPLKLARLPIGDTVEFGHLGNAGMTEDREKSAVEPVDEPKTFAEFAMVRLRRRARGFGVRYPAGSVGVVVDRHKDGIAYEVEFDSPRPGVAGGWPVYRPVQTSIYYRKQAATARRFADSIDQEDVERSLRQMA